MVNPISKTGQSNGTTVYQSCPPMFTVRDGAVASVQDVVEGEIAVTIDKQKGVDVEFTSLEETLTVDGLLKSKVIQAKASALANQIDQDLHAETKEVLQLGRHAGHHALNLCRAHQGPQRLDEMALKQDGRIGVLPRRTPGHDRLPVGPDGSDQRKPPTP